MKLSSIALSRSGETQVLTVSFTLALAVDLSALFGQAQTAIRQEGELGSFNLVDPASAQAPAAPQPEGVKALVEPEERKSRRKPNPLGEGEATEAPLAQAPVAKTRGSSRRPRHVPPAETSSGSSAVASASTAATKSHSDISDADLSKAASNGARVLTPKVVTEVLAKMGVSGTRELRGEQRREFIETLKKMVAK